MSENTTRRGDDGTEDWTDDLFARARTGYATISLDSELLQLELDNSDVGLGLEILQDGPSVGLSAGTLGEENPRIQSFHSLDIDDAKAVRDALDDAIEAAEEANQPAKDDAQQSMLDKIVGTFA